MTEKFRPGGEIATRELHFFWVVDCSGSMTIDGKMSQLNTAIREALPHMKSEAEENPHAKMIVKAIKFSNGASWHITDTPLEDFEWIDLEAKRDELTDMGSALTLVADQLKIPPMPDRGLPPVIALVSDGMPTDDFNKGLKDLLDQPWAKKALKIGIAIGKDAELAVLEKFMNDVERRPLTANNPDQLAKYIKWVSTVVIKAASAPPSAPAPAGGIPGGPASPIPEPPAATSEDIDAEDVW